MDKVSVTDPLRRVAGDTAAALLAQPTYQRDKRARQKMARAVEEVTEQLTLTLALALALAPTLTLT